MSEFNRAEAVWKEKMSHPYNQFMGFYTAVEAAGMVTVRIAARSYYRLYVNGEMRACGPARAAEHFCRVDEIPVRLEGTGHIAVEVAAIAKPVRYCNDCTMEPGMFAAEITDADKEVLSATGDGSWSVTELTYRRSAVETMSHSRGILEYCDLNPHSYEWRLGKGAFEQPVCVDEEITYLPRRSRYPTYRSIDMEVLSGFYDMIPEENAKAGFVLELARTFNKEWYDSLLEENCYLESLRKERDGVFTGSFSEYEKAGRRWLEIVPKEAACAFLWERQTSELGFIDFTITVDRPGIVDVINSDHLHVSGALKANSYVTRYTLLPGSYHLTTFEPKLTRYIKMIFRTEGKVNVSFPQLLDYAFPDSHAGDFSCSDGELNMIYQGARRTLRLCTLDIFMDCPQRERGGWLCDSHFSAQAAWQMFGDTGVERDFIENFMLTDPDVTWKSFFPEVYPGTHRTPEEVGITNWSFWLLTELYDYYYRSGDREFIEQCRTRVERFVEGLLSLKGESGLLENMGSTFVDWSLSNRSFCLSPISVPINCLAVNMLEKMSELYRNEAWMAEAGSIRKVIEELDRGPGLFGGNGDAALLLDGRLCRGEALTESGAALELWSGFHTDDPYYQKTFVETMGYAPKHRPNPNVGRANLFIGLMLRFDVLAGLGRAKELIREWKAVYLPELKDGSGTFFENYNAVSGCHGFNGATGALMTNVILGLGQPREYDKTVVIAPHPCDLAWAKGTAACSDGKIALRWDADYESHVLRMLLNLPKNWTCEMKLPFELHGWTVTVNGKTAEGLH